MKNESLSSFTQWPEISVQKLIFRYFPTACGDLLPPLYTTSARSCDRPSSLCLHS